MLCADVWTVVCTFGGVADLRALSLVDRQASGAALREAAETRSRCDCCGGFADETFACEEVWKDCVCGNRNCYDCTTWHDEVGCPALGGPFTYTSCSWGCRT